MVMRSAVLAVVVGGLMMSLATAQEKKAVLKKETVKEEMKEHAMVGYLTDKMCSKRFLGQEGAAKAAKHTKDCATEEGCAASGYGLIFDGKFYKFDEAGDKKSAEYLKMTKRENNLLVKVEGKMDGEKMLVKSIADAEVKKEMKKEKGKM